MAIYRYQHGDRPLEGYTIQHGLGRGGFGEVYYALSDAGREVALKAVQNYEDIELRGIKHCMNLKNPQLVSIFDIKHTQDNLPFVVMEYIDGPSLRDILDSHPDGLGPAKAAFFLQEMAKGLAYLHDCGVVHRDLKPHNVFYENGVVKIGDYSLSKAINTSHRSGHTVTVGTVHYMAPEISMGRYDHTVDIYALGVMLYEMLKGHPPFLGSSMGEVLMKHVAGDVDVSNIQQPFARVIKKALSKEPHDRYQSAQSMIDDLLGHSELQQSVASLGPETLTVIAEQAMTAARDRVGAEQPRQPEPAPTAAVGYQQAGEPQAYKEPRWFNRCKKDFRRLRSMMPELPPVTEDQVAEHVAKARTWTGTVWPYLRFPVFGFLVVFSMVACVAMAESVHNPTPVILGIVAWSIFFKKRWRKRKNANQEGPRPTYEAMATSNPPPAAPYAAHVATPHVAAAVNPGFGAHVELETPGVNESPYSRFVALVMSTFGFLIPIMGLQRLYVGKVKTGLLWMFTFGLFGLGQLYDTILIALGHFKDVDGRRVLSFTREKVSALKQPVNDYSNVVRRRWTESRVGFKLGGLLANLVGACLLLVALGAGAISAIDIPAGMASGAFGTSVMEQHVRAWDGIRDWNLFVTFGFSVVALVSGTLAAICLVFARRESTWGHMLRIPVAAAAFVASIAALGTTTEFGQRWYVIAEQSRMDRWGTAFQHFMNNFWPGAIVGSLCFVAAVFILAWPAKKRTLEVVESVEAVDHQREKQTV